MSKEMYLVLCVILMPGVLLADVDRGIQLYQQKQYQQAEAELRASVEQEPENARAHYYLGLVRLEQGNLQAAEESLRRAIELDPNSPRFKVSLAGAQLRQRRVEEAEKLIREVADADKMVERFQHFLKLAPDSPEAPRVRSLLRAVR